MDKVIKISGIVNGKTWLVPHNDKSQGKLSNIEIYMEALKENDLESLDESDYKIIRNILMKYAIKKLQRFPVQPRVMQTLGYL